MPPFAFTRFCVSNPADCDRSEGGELSWTKAAQALVRQVNNRVNRQIHARNEPGDDWRADVKSGDCEDFALTKRRALIAQGVPASALSMATALTREGEGHAVLVVRTDGGDYVLDNRTDRLVRWHQANLTWLKISSAEDPRIWRTLN